MEGINKIATGSLVSLSEQELVDCDRSVNSGCGGGLMDYAYDFVVENHGIDTEDDYPFQGRETTCNRNKLKRHFVTIDGYKDVPPNNEKELLQVVTAQPVSIGICGSERSFQLYSGVGVSSGNLLSSYTLSKLNMSLIKFLSSNLYSLDLAQLLWIMLCWLWAMIHKMGLIIGL